MSSTTPVALTALGANLIAVTHNAATTTAQWCPSSDYGANFGSPNDVASGLPCDRAVAVAYKPNGDFAIVGASGAGGLAIAICVSGTYWYQYAKTSPPAIYGLAMYYDGDWNIIALCNINDTFKLARIAFGDGYRVSAGFWSALEYLNLGRAEVSQYALVQNYYDTPPWERQQLPRSPNTSRKSYVISRGGKGGGGISKPGMIIAKTVKGYRRYVGEYPAQEVLIPAPIGILRAPDWQSARAIMAARAIDNLDFDAPFICKPSGAPPILSLYKQGDKWCYRLKPATDFYDADWSKAEKLKGSCTYGLAVACDSTYVWGTRANEVWRSPLPAQGWPTPTAGTGAGGSSQTVPQDDIVEVEEMIRPMGRSTLAVILDNSGGDYASLPGTYIKKGSRVTFAYGYAGETPTGNQYFIEDWVYDRAPDQATVTLTCIDAWGLLEQYRVPGNQELNYAGNDYTVYDLIEKLMACIGGTLTYVSRSSDIYTLYPRLTVNAGETGAGLLRRLLELVPDVIYFVGLTGYILYPQTSDSPVYSYKFPGDN